MASGFYELEGGTQPGLPAAGSGRLWYDTTANQWKVLLSSGANIPLTNINQETEITTISPDDEVLVYDTSAAGFKKMRAANIVPLAVPTRYVTYDEDDFVGSVTASKLQWVATTAGTGASAQIGSYGVNGTERAYGVAQIDTGTTATGRCTFTRMLNLVQLGYAAYDQVWRVAMEEVSSGTDRFLTHIGFIDNTGAGEHTDGAYFRCVDNVNSGNWQCVCREAAIETVVNTTVSPNTNYNIFRININTAGTSVEFYINDVLVATIATNIPTTAGAFTGIGVKIEKTVGTTQRNLSIDYHTMKVEWSGGR